VDPGYLIASPQLRDGNFARTVVLLVHHDDLGALGLVITRETETRQGEVAEELEERSPERAARPVLWGGPVEPGVGFVVFARGTAEDGNDGWNVGPLLRVSASGDRLAALVAAGVPFELCLGYAGWGPGQLDREYAEGSWVHLDPSVDLVFGARVADRYDDALARLGLRAETLWMTPIDE
jgi:putative transcriptional regulator